MCYRCGGKFSPLHRCPPKTLQSLIGEMEEDSENEEDSHEDAAGVEFLQEQSTSQQL